MEQRRLQKEDADLTAPGLPLILITAHYNLGIALRHLDLPGSLEQALGVFQRAHSLAKERLGPHHATTQHIARDLARFRRMSQDAQDEARRHSNSQGQHGLLPNPAIDALYSAQQPVPARHSMQRMSGMSMEPWQSQEVPAYMDSLPRPQNGLSTAPVVSSSQGLAHSANGPFAVPRPPPEHVMQGRQSSYGPWAHQLPPPPEQQPAPAPPPSHFTPAPPHRPEFASARASQPRPPIYAQPQVIVCLSSFLSEII